MDKLIHLVYTSVAEYELTGQELHDFLEKIKSKNKILDITGMLLYSDGSYLQVLEGEKKVVENLYEVIKLDPRHRTVNKLLQDKIAKRDFKNWSMGYAKLTAEDIINTIGFNDFFKNQSCLAEISAGKAKDLLYAFACGCWKIE